MNIYLSEEQRMLRDTARDFLATTCPVTHVRDMEDDPRGYSMDLWQKMAELGWLKLPFDDDGNQFFNLALLAEQMGVVLLPSPFIPTMAAGLVIQQFGSEEQKRSVLPAIGNGDLAISMAMTEPHMRLDEASMGVRAESRDNDFLLFGKKIFIPDLLSANKFLTVVQTRKGVTVFLVNAGAAEMTVEQLPTMAADKQYEAVFKGVRVRPEDIIGVEGGGWHVAKSWLNYAATLQSAYSVGAAEKALGIVKEFTKSRVQFGKTVSQFQAIQHKLADSLVLLDGARLLTYQAAWKLGKGLPAEFEVAAAKSWVGDAFQRISEEGMRIMASIAYSRECDMQLYYRRATALKVSWGDPYYYRTRIAEMMGI